MKCRHCNEGEMRVLETRTHSGALWRRRECTVCRKRMTTCETERFVNQIEQIGQRLQALGFKSEKIEEILGVSRHTRRRARAVNLPSESQSDVDLQTAWNSPNEAHH